MSEASTVGSPAASPVAAPEPDVSEYTDVFDDEKISPVDLPEHVPYLLIGGGTASMAAFRSIKAREPKAKVLIITEEAHAPYMRPPLSKELWFTKDEDTPSTLKFAQWNGKERSIFFEPNEFYIPIDKLTSEDNENGGVSIAAGITVVKLDINKKTAFTKDNREIKFDKCLIATGGTPRNLPVLEQAGDWAKEKVTIFRNIHDFRKVHSIANKAKSITIIGGGFLGSELACALSEKARSGEMEVTQIYKEKGNMAQVLPEYLSNWATDKVQGLGVKLKPDSYVTAAKKEGKKVVLTLNNGESITTDHVLVAVGVNPNDSLAATSGLEVDDKYGGYRVNSELEARSNVWVAGDAACFYDIKLGRRRVEHHDHAVVSGRLAGKNMTGAGEPYWHQSMFWSDLGPDIGYEAIGIVDSKLETVGVFAKATEKDTPKAVVEETGDSVRSETEQTAENKTTAVDEATPEPHVAETSDDYGKGVVFYVRDSTVVGVLLWNVFNKMGVARKVIRESKQFEDLSEVAKLFKLHQDPVQ